MDDVSRQRHYYEVTAAHYESMHVHPLDEHGIALALLAGIARHIGATSILDVGAGTGRAMRLLQDYLPDVRVVGVEPAEGLREIGYAGGIARECLVDGSGEALPFADDAFDIVIETGVLHHVAQPRAVVREMCRVAGRGVLVSDGNNYGQGGRLTRLAKRALRSAGLWRGATWLATGGKMSKFNEADGLFYSYSLFDDLPEIARKFPRQYITNTHPLRGFDLLGGAPVAAIIALRDPW